MFLYFKTYESAHILSQIFIKTLSYKNRRKVSETTFFIFLVLPFFFLYLPTSSCCYKKVRISTGIAVSHQCKYYYSDSMTEMIVSSIRKIAQSQTVLHATETYPCWLFERMLKEVVLLLGDFLPPKLHKDIYL